VQALKTLGKEHVDQAVIETLRQQTGAALRERILGHPRGDGLDLPDHQAGLPGV
jgi:hypothetical protein